ncbi:MAG: c-type cytochrome [Alphaproteobacteria bacterium]|nr:c-type cytochrome [Alphaproteobacteria bacterium]MCB9699028.1 c-type cytochrome [Alphaproteobacteria bacterium]
MSRETNRLLGHAEENDGIEEYDNALPDWWLGLFIFTIIWGIGYAVEYHFVSGRSQAGYYEAEMVAAAEKWPESKPQALAFDDATVAAGKEIFGQQCASCHGAALTGGIGPNLVDATWIHGGEPEQIRATITNGVPEKGMPTWGPILGPDKIAKVAAYVVTEAKKGGSAAPVDGQVAATGGTEEPMTGEAIFKQNCVACHGENMQGLVGPSLVDAEWIHGGTLEDITHTITNGVPEKGMVSWGPILGEEKIGIVAKYVFDQNQAATAQN